MAKLDLREAFPGELRDLDADGRARFVETVARQLRVQLGLDPDLMTKSLPRGTEIQALRDLDERLFAAFTARHQRLAADLDRLVRGRR